MGNAFKKKKIYFVGTSSTPVTLTGTYQNGTAIFVGEAEQVGLDIAYTMGSGETSNTLNVKIEFAGDDGDTAPTTWFQEITESASSGTITMLKAARDFDAVSAAGTADNIHVPIPLDAKWVRISVKETGISQGGNGGTVTITGTLTMT